MDLDDDDAEDEEDADPHRAGDEPELDRHVALHAPAATHDIPHSLASTGAWKVPIEMATIRNYGYDSFKAGALPGFEG